MKVKVLRNVFASGVPLTAGKTADIREADAKLLARMGKVEILGKDAKDEIETEALAQPETAMKSKGMFKR